MNKKIDVMIRVLLLPFTESEFIENDPFQTILNKCGVDFSYDTFNVETDKMISLLLNSIDIKTIDEIYLQLKKFHIEPFLVHDFENIYDYYDELINIISEIFITFRDGQLCLKYWTSETEKSIFDNCPELHKALMWNSLTRIMLPDILYAKYLTKFTDESIVYQEGFYNEINLADAQLDAVLSKGLAETHVHIGATTTFYNSWENLMYMNDNGKYIISQIKNNSIFNIMNINMYSSKEKTELMIMYAALSRLLLILYFSNVDRNINPYIKEYFDIRINQIEYGLAKDKICNLYNEIRLSTKEHQSISAKIAFGFGAKYNTYDENVFLSKAYKVFSANQTIKDVSCIKKIFYNYIRIKNDFYKSMTQPNNIKGLSNFKRYFSNSTKIGRINSNNPDGKPKYLVYLNYAFKNPKIKYIEYRIGLPFEKSLEKNVKIIKKELKYFFSTYMHMLVTNSTVHYPLVGLIFSFIKTEDKPNKCLMNYKNYNNDKSYLHYISLRDQYKMQLCALQYIRKLNANISKYIIGIDAASIEHATEPWVFAPIYKEFARSKDYDSLINSQTLKYTFHVGEEFRSIVSGLRHIDEVIEEFGYHSGDRIGHGAVLGVDIRKWMDCNKIYTISRIELLENYLWIWGLRTETSISIENEGYLERKIMQIAEEIYESTDGITVYTLWRTYKNKFKEINDFSLCNFDKDSICELFCKPMIWNSEKLLLSNHCSHYIKRMQEPIIISSSYEDVAMYNYLQKYVKSKVSNKGIVVETNPTSNSAITEIENIYDHYIFALNPLKNDSESKVIVTINSDDPSVFNTNTTNELAYIYYSLIDKGTDRNIALEWIDKIREYSLLSTFIKNHNISKKELINELRMVIDCLD